MTNLNYMTMVEDWNGHVHEMIKILIEILKKKTHMVIGEGILFMMEIIYIIDRSLLFILRG